MYVLQSTCKMVLTVVLAMAAMDNKVSPRCAVYSGPACTCASMCACVSAFVCVFVRVCLRVRARARLSVCLSVLCPPDRHR